MFGLGSTSEYFGFVVDQHSAAKSLAAERPRVPSADDKMDKTIINTPVDCANATEADELASRVTYNNEDMNRVM